MHARETGGAGDWCLSAAGRDGELGNASLSPHMNCSVSDVALHGFLGQLLQAASLLFGVDQSRLAVRRTVAEIVSSLKHLSTSAHFSALPVCSKVGVA